MSCSRVLVVDDHGASLRAMGTLLTSMGLQPALATSGAEALELFDRATFCAAVCDVMMPGGIDGFELVRELRSRQAGRPLFVIMMSAHDVDAKLQKQASAAGADAFLGKPFTASDFQRVWEERFPPEEGL